MHKLKVALAAAMLATSFGAGAVVDTRDNSNTPNYFVDVDANKTSAPYYRYYSGDWSWAHAAIAGPISSATLSISSFDIDLPDEVDNIYALDSGTWTLLGNLSGAGSTWSYTTFNLGSNFDDDIAAGLQVKIDIDSTHTSNTWAVSLAKSVLTTESGDTLPDPVPGIPEPETYAMMLAGLGLLAFARRRKQSAA